MTDTIFILGIARRSGTNYLSDLLALHPECRRVARIAEDYLLANAHHLEEFVSQVARAWEPRWDPDEQARRALAQHLGAACVGFLAATTGGALPRYLVTKTPSVANLHLAPRFPGARVIVLVRDGRDVVASAMRSFAARFAASCREWAQAARAIAAARRDRVPFLLVRYEDVVGDLRGALARIFAFLDLDAGAYDFAGAERLPVRGSSTFGTEAGRVHWQPVEKTRDFKPLGRWAEWSPTQHRRFNHIAGVESRYFGYQLVPVERRRWLRPTAPPPA